jgi:hypothetical protein
MYWPPIGCTPLTPPIDSHGTATTISSARAVTHTTQILHPRKPALSCQSPPAKHLPDTGTPSLDGVRKAVPSTNCTQAASPLVNLMMATSLASSVTASPSSTSSDRAQKTTNPWQWGSSETGLPWMERLDRCFRGERCSNSVTCK